LMDVFDHDQLQKKFFSVSKSAKNVIWRKWEFFLFQKRFPGGIL